MKQTLKRWTAMLLSLVMVLTMIPAAIAAGMDEKLVSSLAAVYDGDEDRAREDLELLYNAGIIDESGAMVALDVREDGASAELDELAARIANGESVGAITVNGHEVTPEQLARMQQVSAMLELVRLLDKDVEITDEHVANFEALVEGIADGSVDLDGALRSGQLSLLGSESAGYEEHDLTLSEGKYTAPMLDGASYDAAHEFLADPATSWYTDDAHKGVVTDGVVSLSADKTSCTPGQTVTVTATLNKAQPVPVSFDWKAVSGSVGISGTNSGTVTWAAGESEDKTFSFTLAAQGDTSDLANLWQGGRAVVVSASNIQNALFEGEAKVWNQTLTVTASDNNAIKASYTTDKSITGFTFSGAKYNPKGMAFKYAYVLTNVIPYSLPFTLNVSYPRSSSITAYLVHPSADMSSITANINTETNLKNSGKKFTGIYASSSSASSFSKTVSVLYTGGTEDGNVATADYTQLFNDSNNRQTYLLLRYGGASSTPSNSVSASVTLVLPSEHDKVLSVSVPAGTYRSGEVVPVTVTLDNFVVADSGTKLTVNGVSCSLLDAASTETKKLTFGYTVRDVDTGAVNVTAISGLKNANDKSVSLDAAFPSTSFGVDQGVTLVSDVKNAGIDWDNVKYGVSDGEAGGQTVTVVLPIKSGSDKAWLVSENTAFSSTSVALPIPGYESAVTNSYVSGAYLSTDGGETRYPLYVAQSGDMPVALVARFTAAPSESAALRQDTLNLFMDPNVVTEAGKYLPALTAESDLPLTATANAAPIALGRSWSVYIKGGAAFEPTGTVSRGIADYDGLVADGFLKLGDDAYVVLQDAANPDKQYDVEIVVNRALRDALVGGVRVEDGQELRLWTQFSSRKPFTFTNASDFALTSGDETVAATEAAENGVFRVLFTGAAGGAPLTLTVLNGGGDKTYTLNAGTVTVKAGKTPFLTVAEYSTVRTTLTNTDTDVLFSSNLTARNAAEGTATTTFAATLYAAEASGASYAKTGGALWTANFDSTLASTVTHITVPAAQLASAGAYALEIGAADASTGAAMSATAYIVAKQAPAKVTLNKLDSYSVTSDAVPAIGYTVTPASATVEYTVQKSGEAVGERQTVTGGSIPFSASTPAGLKEQYVITVYARNNDTEPWSVDSMMLGVYNKSALDIIMADVTAGQIGGTTGGAGTSVKDTTVALDNHGKLNDYLTDSDYQLTFDDFETLRTDMSLQKVISANYGSGAWGMLSDKLSWESSNGSLVSVDYRQGGIYSDIRNYSYTTYAPATDFLLVGKGRTENAVTIKATHAGTGASAQFTVTATTLENQLYTFQFFPNVVTRIIYTNGHGDHRELVSNENGELAVYEPTGIASTVMAMSQSEGETYVGTLYADDLRSGERDIASLQLYPCNNLRLRKVSAAELTFLNPNGTRYSGSVTLRVGVYKNDVYCPGALVKFINGAEVNLNGRQDVTATVTDGKLSLGFDASQFKHNSDDTGLTQLDDVSYIIEYSAEGFRTAYVRLNAFSDMDGAARPTDSLIQLRALEGLADTPQIVAQSIQQYDQGTSANDYTRDVIDFTENIGVSKRFSKTELFTDAALSGESVGTDANGYTTYTTQSPIDFALYTTSGKLLGSQTHSTKTEADQIVDLRNLASATLYVFPFSSVPMARGVYTMTDETMAADGISDVAEGCTPSVRVKLLFTRGDLTIRSETMPFGVSNLSHRKNLADEGGGAKEIGTEVKGDLKESVDIGTIFKNIGVNEMLAKGFAFLGGLGGGGRNPLLDLMILPTEDPATFHIIAFIGDGGDSESGGDGVSVNYDPNALYEDMHEFEEELDKLDDDDNDSEMDDDDDEGGEGKIKFSFHGALHLVARCDVVHDKWGINFAGGAVGAGLKATYEWKQNLMCGPVPVLLSLNLGFKVDLELSFANKDAVRAMLLDAAVELSVTAFAGVGFDLSLIEFKLGVEGNITAGVNFLYLTRVNKTGTKLSIDGKISLVMEVKVAIVSYSKTFASTGFGWSNTYGSYDMIRQAWAEQGFAELTGVTASGRRYTMNLLSDGTGVIEIEGEGEIENRDYLLTVERVWNDGTGMRLLGAEPLTTVQTNAYPYANPVLTDDGGMFVYISDNDNADELQSVASYAVRNASGGYENRGAIATEDVLLDSDVVASGTDSNVFAAWVKQMESPNKEMHDKVNTDDLGIMLNASEIYVGKYDGSAWTTRRLTDNTVADLAPTVASSGDRAIVAWRSLSASALSATDVADSFDAENQINYSYYQNGAWTDAQIAYNGSAGTVNAIDSAMLSDGTAILVYTVRTGSKAETTETFYTVIGADGKAVTTARLTNNDAADSGARVAALGNAFVLGWYAEDKAGNSTSAEGAVSDAHDIRLARVTANGSVDANFPESLSVPTASDSFRFSAPVGGSDLSDLSVVWAELNDEQLYELNAVRFYQQGDTIGVGAPMTIAQTGKYYAVDSFDSYTGADGEVYVLALGSDYSTDSGSIYDTITAEEPIEFVNGEGVSANQLVLTEQNPVASIKLGSASFPDAAIEAEAETNLKELTPGLNLPVRFTVTNTGMTPVTSVTLSVDNQSKTVSGISLLPGKSAVYVMSYLVPDGSVSDQTYSVTAVTESGNAAANGTLVLNRPDVGVYSLKLLREGDGTRDVQAILYNMSGIPLSGSGKTVKLAFYKDSSCLQRVDDEITIPATAYADIDEGVYSYLKTLNVSDFIGGAAEIPDGGVTVFAKAWVSDSEELYTFDNVASLTFSGLLAKYGAKYSTDSAIADKGNDTYDVVVEARNNSLQSADLGEVQANILDSQNNVLASVPLGSVTLNPEETRSLSRTGVALTTAGKPASVQLFSAAQSVTLDVAANNGECTVAYLTLTAEGKLPDTLPEATRDVGEFRGWFTAAKGGEKVNPGDEVEPGTTLYAQFGYLVVMSDYAYTYEAAPTPTLDDDPLGDNVSITYYWTDKEGGFAATDAVDFGTAWSAGAPVYPGTYYIRALISGEDGYAAPYNTPQTEFHVTNRNDTEPNKKYEITVTANSNTVTYDGTAKTVSGFQTLEYNLGSTTYTVSGLSASASGTDFGTYTATVTGTAVVKDDHDHDVTAQFIVNTVDGSLTINKRNVTLTSATDAKEYDGTALTNSTVTVTGDGWATGEGATYDVTGSQKLVGSNANSFTYTLNDGTKAGNYTITTAPGTLTVTNRTAKYEVSPQANSATVKYDGQEHSVSGFVTDTFTVDGNDYTVSGLTASGSGTDAGSHTVSVSGTAVVKDSDENDVTSQFSVTPQTGTLTINRRNVTLTSTTDAKEYDGTALTNGTVTVSGDGFVTGEGATYNVTGTRTLAGVDNNTFTYALNDNTKADNYTITTNYGTLTINNRATKYAVTLKANSGEYKYDGEAKTVSGWTINNVSGGGFTAENGLNYTVEGMTASVTQTDAGTYTVNVTGTPVVKDSGGNDVSEQFAVSTESGSLTINRRAVTLTSATDTKAYDGAALTNSTVTVTGDGWATGEGATYNVTGSQTLPDNSQNAFTYTLNAGTKTENYDVTKVEGTLTITNRNDVEPDKKYEITVTANSDTVYYDGTEKTVSGFETLEYTFNDVTYTVSGLSASVSGTNAGTYTAEVTGTAVVKDAANNDLTAQFIVTTENGTLTINKKLAPASLTDEQKPTPVPGLTDIGGQQALANPPVNPLDGYTVEYRLDTTGWSDLLPTAKDRGDYTVHVRYVADDNHEPYNGTDTLTATISKQADTIVIQDSPSRVKLTVDNRTGSPMKAILDEAMEGNSVDVTHDDGSGQTTTTTQAVNVELLVVDHTKDEFAAVTGTTDDENAAYRTSEITQVYDISLQEVTTTTTVVTDDNDAVISSSVVSGTPTPVPYAGGSMMVTLPYDKSHDPEGTVYSVVYAYQDGGVWKYEDMKATYDDSIKAFTFHTTHTSTYFVYAETVTAADVAEAFELVLKPSGTDGRTYDVILNATDGKIINRLTSADLTFSLTGGDGKITSEITANAAAHIKLNSALSAQGRYEFYVDGTDYSDVSGRSITLGSVTFGGYGSGWTFKITNAVVNTTAFNDNVVVTKSYNGGVTLNTTDDTNTVNYTAKIDPLTISPDTKNLTVNVTFPNAVADNASDYQDMTLTVSGGDLSEDIVVKLGGSAYMHAANYDYGTATMPADVYTVTLTQVLTANTQYTVTISGAGYRTARYIVLMNDNKTLTFWNNVMDEATVVEAGKDSSAVKVTYLAGDIVQDAQINIYDLSAVVSFFGEIDLVTSHPEYAKYDLNRDGKIDSIDVAYVLISWGK